MRETRRSSEEVPFAQEVHSPTAALALRQPSELKGECTEANMYMYSRVARRNRAQVRRQWLRVDCRLPTEERRSEHLELLRVLLDGRDGNLLLVVVVEVARVAGALHFGHERRLLDLALVDSEPVGARKPLGVLDVRHAGFQVAVALRQVHLQHVPREVLQVRREVLRVLAAALRATHVTR